MAKTRVPQGERYWHIGQWGDILMAYEEDSPIDDWLFQCGNYFRTKEEAEAMAKKIRAVLKGADVIEMPSEEEKKKYMLAHCAVEDNKGRVHYFRDITFGFNECYNWLKSKIVK